MSERSERMAAEICSLEIAVDEARELLTRVLAALDEEIDLGGRVPFDPAEIRAFLESIERFSLD